MAVSYKIQHVLTVQYNNCILGHLYQRNENLCHTETNTWICTAALFKITKRWKQLRCSLVGEWLNKLVYPYQRMFIQQKKKRGYKLVLYVPIWMNLKGLCCVEKSQPLKVTYCMISWWRTELWLPEARAGRGWKMSMAVGGAQRILVMELFYILTVVVITQAHVW